MAVIRAVVARTLAVLLVAAAWSPRPARADAIVGTGTGDSCTEAALNAALGCGAPSGSPPASNCDSGGTVTFNCGGAATITVTNIKTINGDTTIDGGSLITISGGNSVGVFAVNTGVKFTVQNLTIANGTSAGGDGGAIWNGGTLTVTNSTFSGNGGGSDNIGGGIYNGGTLTVANSTFSDNSARGNGGGIWNGGTLTVTNCTFSRNFGGLSYSGSGGGAIFNGGKSTLTVTDSTFSGNGAAWGSGIFNNSGSTLTVTNSTFSGNGAAWGGGPSGGGGIANGGTLTVTNSTFSGNSAFSGGGIDSYGGTATVTNSTFSGNSWGGGGGIYNEHATLTVTNSTFSGNSAGQGGGIINFSGTVTVTNSTFSGNGASGNGINNNSGMLTVTNTIVANSTPGGNCSGSVTDGGHNIDDGTTCGFTGTSLSNTDPKLDPAGLANNGGPTQTIALLASSPAINAGDETVCATGPVWNLDQRGYVRPGTGSSNCSIGAYEFESPGLGPATPTNTPTLTATPTNTAAITPNQTATATPSLTNTPTNTLTTTPTSTPTATQSLSPSVTPTLSPTPCIGDCNGDGSVTVNEILTMVNIALGNADVTACPNGIPSGAQVDVALILTGVNNALNGCAAQTTGILQFVGFDSNGITQADSVRENSADVDILQEICPSETPEPFTQTIINATFRNNEAADLHLQRVAITVGGLAPITHQIDGEIRGGLCSNIDQQCSADGDCYGTGSCVHTETTINGILLFDFSDKQRFLSQPGTYSATITFSASDPVHTFQTSTGYTVTFADYDNCTTTGG